MKALINMKSDLEAALQNIENAELKNYESDGEWQAVTDDKLRLKLMSIRDQIRSLL